MPGSRVSTMVTGGKGVWFDYLKWLATLVAEETDRNVQHKVIVAHLSYDMESRESRKREAYGLKHMKLEMSIDGVSCFVSFSTPWHQVKMSIEQVFNWLVRYAAEKRAADHMVFERTKIINKV